MTSLLWLIIALPLGGALFLHFAGRFLREPLPGWLATAAMSGSFLIALAAAIPFFRGDGPTETLLLWEWMPAIGANLEIQWDPLSALMTLVVTGVGSLIHLFSIGYMHGDDRFGRFFTYLNLFAASMLTLVLAGNFAMLFLGWELVGLCSYLLIGFWFTRHSAAGAAKKAFVVNRIGDLGLMVGLMLVFATFGTLSYTGVLDRADELSTATATAIGLLFLLGAAGKSAQIPLYVWLPDAMEGPTPVSALIHAATMVTAGVYLVARSAAIFDLSEVAQVTVATVGAVTALWAASIALAQRDIKKVLAYSTVSQLGFMFLAVGATAYVAGIFHLMTHAFFKALLFLGAGAVIHGMSGEQDMRRMGGLFTRMRVTAVTMAIGVLAISGIPPLAGFWSKDEIVASAFARSGWFGALMVVALLAAVLTAFYMTRLWVMVFLGQPRWDEAEVHPHEAPRVMTLPLVALAGLTLVGGLINTPFRYTLEHFLEPAFEGVAMQHPPEGWLMFTVLAGVSVLAGVAGIAAAFLAYHRPEEQWLDFEDSLQPVWGAWEGAYRVDDLYGAAIVAPGRKAAGWAAFSVDVPVIDGLVNGVGRVVRGVGDTVRQLQTGQVRTYGALLLTGGIAVVLWLVATGS